MSRRRLAESLSATLAALPLGMARGVGAAAARLAWWGGARARRDAQHNLAICYPGMPADERDRLALAATLEGGRALAEAAWSWRRPRHRWLAQRVEVVNGALHARALAEPRPLIIVTPHIGAWEVSMAVASGEQGLRYFYRPPRDASLEPLLRRGRANLGGIPLRLDAGGIRDALRALRRGEPVGLLPDQEPERAGGVFAPFFGTPALTMTLLSRLVAKSDAQVLFLAVLRCPGGWRAHWLEAMPGIGSTDPVVAATAVNASVERCIALAPTQYLWGYRRFRARPDGSRHDYHARP